MSQELVKNFYCFRCGKETPHNKTLILWDSKLSVSGLFSRIYDQILGTGNFYDEYCCSICGRSRIELQTKEER